ncbi:MAG: class I SAM-dependent methyltransferase [Stigonema ocellatum SAG 48.90 = DSM 106950]|nr:class I SAM-dependent methyltransferase [Stigonema ocellatum SAG 48.90 = DSM 106950]
MSATQCPVCSSYYIRIHSHYRLKQNGDSDLPSDYQLLVCSTCGLWFKDNLLTEESLRHHYENIQVELSHWNYSERLPHEQKIDDILSKLPEASKVLDVGCWTGRLLTPHYPKLKVHGIELNTSAAAVARQNGLYILGSDVTEDLASFGPFDCITMVDVFEHLREPMKILSNLICALSQGGRLLIVTGRTDCLSIRLAGSTYWYFSCPEHLIFLNHKVANWLDKNMPNVRVCFKPIRHFKFKLSRFLFEFLWLICWRFLSPHSPFPKLTLYKLHWFKRFELLKEPVVCGMWKDHALFTIEKLS